MLHHIDFVGRTVLGDVEHRAVIALVDIDAVVVANRIASNDPVTGRLPGVQFVAATLPGEGEATETGPLRYLRAVSATELSQLDPPT